MAVLDYARSIKATVSMLEVAEYYGFAVNRRTRKILCPFHADSHPSMHIYSGDKGYHCFVCGAGGDVIDFVMRLFGLSFQDACRKMDEDFHLGLDIGKRKSRDDQKKAEKEFRIMMEKKEAARRKRKFLICLYHAAYNRFTFLDILKRNNAPTDFNHIAPEYIYAVKHIDQAWQDVEDAAEKIRQFEEQLEQQKRSLKDEIMKNKNGISTAEGRAARR